MNAWAPDELTAFGERDEIEISSLRRDGTARPFITIWIARVGKELFVRSAHGPENGWFRRARASGLGRIRVSGQEREVAFETPAPEMAGPLTAAYHAKYDGYGPRIVGAVVSPEAESAALRLAPR